MRTEIKLSHPISVGGVPRSTISIRPPTREDLASALILYPDLFERGVALVGTLTGLDCSTVLQIEHDDMRKIGHFLANYLD